jgi:hypothetical protein
MVAYNVTLQTHEEHQPQRHVELFRGLTGEFSEPPAPDPVGRASLALTPQASPLSPGATSCESSHRPAGYIPIPYPFIPNETVDDESARFKTWCEDSEQRLQRASRTSLSPPTSNEGKDLPPTSSSIFTTTPAFDDIEPPPTLPHLLRAMSKDKLTPPVFPSGPLNLNPDGTDIDYKKSHAGPHATYWANADGEEIERLFTTGTIRPIVFQDIPTDRVVTYVYPVCVEKRNEDGSLNFRTRLTIGGDRIQYPYDKTAVTAEMEALKILLNCMISENASWSTIDLTDFYLGTDLPHPEFIRIPLHLIPANVIEFYNLYPFVSGKACFVLSTRHIMVFYKRGH